MPHKDPRVGKVYFAKRAASRYRDAIANNLCVNCASVPPIKDGKRCVGCAAQHVKGVTARATRLKRDGRCLRCMGASRPGRNTCATCSAAQVAQNLAEREQRKDIVFAAYGGAVCACCGELERAFLTIDHMNNDGKAHRKVVGSGALLGWLVKNHFPVGFQVLCMNCNFAKGRKGGDGVCPHQRTRLLNCA